jgi:chromosome partitioning protein
MTQNALVASGWYVITAIPDHLSTIGLTILDDKVKRIKQHIEDADTFAGKPKGSTGMSVFGGIIFVKVRIGGSMITNTHADRMTRVAAAFGKGSCYQTYTTELIGFSEAAENYLPIWMQSSPNAKRAADKREYELITKEFASRY